MLKKTEGLGGFQITDTSKRALGKRKGRAIHPQPGSLRAVVEELVAAFPSRVPYQRFTYRDVDALGWLHRHLESACTSPSHSLDPVGDRVWGGDFIADLEA